MRSFLRVHAEFKVLHRLFLSFFIITYYNTTHLPSSKSSEIQGFGYALPQ